MAHLRMGRMASIVPSHDRLHEKDSQIHAYKKLTEFEVLALIVHRSVHASFLLSWAARSTPLSQLGWQYCDNSGIRRNAEILSNMLESAIMRSQSSVQAPHGWNGIQFELLDHSSKGFTADGPRLDGHQGCAAKIRSYVAHDRQYFSWLYAVSNGHWRRPCSAKWQQFGETARRIFKDIQHSKDLAGQKVFAQATEYDL